MRNLLLLLALLIGAFSTGVCQSTTPLKLKGEFWIDAPTAGEGGGIKGYILKFEQKKGNSVNAMRLYLEDLPIEGGKLDIALSGSYGRYRESKNVLNYDSRVCTGVIYVDEGKPGGTKITGTMDLTFHSPIINRTKEEKRYIKGKFTVKYD